MVFKQDTTPLQPGLHAELSTVLASKAHNIFEQHSMPLH